ncbi:hypothetical protein A6S26_29220 [Nostoc sp. ATCC 43529]|nr:hypothetical protein A6S26_29220 [Nostoc sp. ATCC 43529]
MVYLQLNVLENTLKYIRLTQQYEKSRVLTGGDQNPYTLKPNLNTKLLYVNPGTEIYRNKKGEANLPLPPTIQLALLN